VARPHQKLETGLDAKEYRLISGSLGNEELRRSFFIAFEPLLSNQTIYKSIYNAYN
jgi:hypothetical protein